MPKSRPLRSVGALTIRPVTTPVPWGTPANPANVPMPRGDEEWGRASRPCSNDDAIRVNAGVVEFGSDITDLLGAGFASAMDLSDYSAWMALSMIDFHRQVAQAQDEAAKERVVTVAGAHYAARPVLPCAECGHATPHTYMTSVVVMCLVCGDRSLA